TVRAACPAGKRPSGKPTRTVRAPCASILMPWRSPNRPKSQRHARRCATPPEVPAKSVSLTDPAARYTAAPGGPAFYAYSTNYLVDVRAGIIVDVEATPALRTGEVNATRTMIDRVEAEFNLKPTRLIGDMAYGAAKLLDWMINEKRIEPHVPVE